MEVVKRVEEVGEVEEKRMTKRKRSTEKSKMMMMIWRKFTKRKKSGRMRRG